jgi:hypothetical protein
MVLAQKNSTKYQLTAYNYNNQYLTSSKQCRSLTSEIMYKCDTVYRRDSPYFNMFTARYIASSNERGDTAEEIEAIKDMRNQMEILAALVISIGENHAYSSAEILLIDTILKYADIEHTGEIINSIMGAVNNMCAETEALRSLKNPNPEKDLVRLCVLEVEGEVEYDENSSEDELNELDAEKVAVQAKEIDSIMDRVTQSHLSISAQELYAYMDTTYRIEAACVNALAQNVLPEAKIMLSLL